MDTQSTSRRALKSPQELKDRRRRRNERERAQRAAETAQQKSERLRKRRERSRARRVAQTASDRQATLQRKITCEHERMASETPAEREARLQRISDRLAAETPEERETRLQHLYQTYLHFVSTPSELHFSSTNIPATSFTPHHSYELLPLPAFATYPPHLHPPLLQLFTLSSHAIIC